MNTNTTGLNKNSTSTPESQRADFETLGDRKREQIKFYFRSMREFIFADLFKNKDEAKQAAKHLIVDMDTGETIADRMNKIIAQEGIFWGDCSEEQSLIWVIEVNKFAAELPPIKARALLMATDTLDVDVDALAKSLKEYKDAMYDFHANWDDPEEEKYKRYHEPWLCDDSPEAW